MPRIPNTELDVFPLSLGSNVFGWNTDRDESFAVLDAYAAAGGNFVDTADVYSAWIPGNQGGESETIIGEWMAARGNRDSQVVATKVGMLGKDGLKPEAVTAQVEASLKRLQVDTIDLLYIHKDDPDTPIEDALGAFKALIDAGKVRHLAASNYTADRLAEALAVAERESLPRFVALQPEFNLVERGKFEGELQDLCVREDIAAIPYYGLASGFLTGKYRAGSDAVDSGRGGAGAKYLDGPGTALLAVLDEVASYHDGVPVAAVALAWLAAQPAVLAPIASARTPEQLADLLPIATLELTQDELDLLETASDYSAARVA